MTSHPVAAATLLLALCGTALAADQGNRMTILSTAPVAAAPFPPDTVRITYRSGVDGAQDWALFRQGDPTRNTIVYLHGSFSTADQIFTRRDVRQFWLSRILAGRHPLLSVNMRGTSYMSPAATADLTALLAHCRQAFGCRRFVLLGGSGGASSAMAYAVVHPEGVHGVIALGMCDIIERLDYARRSPHPVLQKLATTVFAAYGGTLEEKAELYRARSVLAHAQRLTMPVVLTIGERDPLIPVAGARRIAAAMRHNPHFVYHEVPGGNHDAALWVDIDLQTLHLRPACPASAKRGCAMSKPSSVGPKERTD